MALDAGPVRRVAAWGVHLLTASSAPAGVLAILATERGDAAAALWWMAYTVAIDSVDGTLARAVGVRAVLPHFDGTRLDDLVDYLTYVIVPALFLLGMDLLPPALELPVALAPVLASAYGFCRTDAKTTDHYFTGFPSYWNIVVFYLYTLGWPPAANATVVLALSVAVFVPVRYVYPSRTTALRPLTVGLGLLWGAAVMWVLAHLDAAPRLLVHLSLLFPVYYAALSLLLHRRPHRPDAPHASRPPRLG
jgi:phosphatidylcholine synthase